MDAYLKFMTTAAVYLGAKESEAEEEMRKVLSFETKIAEVRILQVLEGSSSAASGRHLTVDRLGELELFANILRPS